MKNIIVNLAVGAGNDIAGDYAISMAAASAAQRLECEKTAQAAADRFEAAARRAGVSAQSRVFKTTLPGAPDLFGPLARRFDLSVVGQAEPNKIAPEDMIIEAG